MAIQQKTVSRYCKINQAINKVKKEKGRLGEEIRQGLLDGDVLPTDGPWVIELSPNGGKELVNWEQLHEDLLTKIKAKKLGVSDKVARTLVQAEFEDLKNSMPDKVAVNIGGVDYVGGFKLNVRANPKYRVVATAVEKAVA